MTSPDTQSTVPDAEGAIALLTQQRDLYATLRRLTEQQRELISSSRPEDLLGVLAERQKVLDRLNGLNEAVKALRERWSDVYWSLNNRQRARADALVKDVQTMLAAILATDEEDARLLSARIAGGRSESLALAESGRAQRAYTATVATTGSRAVHGPQMFDSTDEQA